MERIMIGGLFDQFASANEIADQLIKRGFSRNQISIASEANTYRMHPQAKIESAAFKTLNIDEVGLAAVTGPVVAGVSQSGDLQEWLQQAGIPKRTSQRCVSAIRKGNTLVVIQVGEDQVDDVLELFSGTHGSGGGIGAYVPTNVIVASPSGTLRKFRNQARRQPEPPAPEEGGTHSSSGEIGG